MSTRVRWAVAACLLICAVPGASKAAPTASFTPHRGLPGRANPAPLYVHFDATATRSSSPRDDAFKDLLYSWNFGDAAAGTWSTTGLPKNVAYGGIAGHVFERPGTYTVTLTVTDAAGTVSTATRMIVVDDPDTVWAGKTACVSTSGNFAGCPGGSERLTSSSLTSALTNLIGSGFRRILFRRGETFGTNRDYVIPFAAETGLIGAFGPEAAGRPRVISGPGTERCVICFQGFDWRVTELDITTQTTRTIPVSHDDRGAADFDRDILIMRNRLTSLDNWNIDFSEGGLPQPHDYIAIVDNELRGQTDRAAPGNPQCFFGGAIFYFFSGNTCSNAKGHRYRITFSEKSVFSHNRILDATGSFEVIKYQCGPQHARDLRCEFNIFSDNVLPIARGLNISGGKIDDPAVIADSIFERNWFQAGLELRHPDNVVRFNAMGPTLGGPAGRVCIQLAGLGATGLGATLPQVNPTGSQIYNNTCRTGGDATAFVGIESGTTTGGTAVNANLFVTRSGVLVNGGSLPGGQNVVTASSPFASSTFNGPADFALDPTAGAALIDAGTPGLPRNVDLLANPAPLGPRIDVGAVEFGTAGPARPAPPVLLGVE